MINICFSSISTYCWSCS